MFASELTNRNKIKIEGRWFKISRVWEVGSEIEVSVSAGYIRFSKEQKVEAK